MKEDAPSIFAFCAVLITIGIAIGFFIGLVRGAEGFPSWIDKQRLLVSYEGKPYRLVECEYMEKKEVKP